MGRLLRDLLQLVDVGDYAGELAGQGGQILLRHAQARQGRDAADHLRADGIVFGGHPNNCKAFRPFFRRRI